MIHVKIKKSKKGHRLEIRNANGNIVNHYYNQPSDAKKAWNAFVKQIIEGKVKFIQ